VLSAPGFVTSTFFKLVVKSYGTITFLAISLTVFSSLREVVDGNLEEASEEAGTLHHTLGCA
jgi:hypothetical protein